MKAAKEIIRICRDSNLLKDYLGERELEVEGIILTLFDQDRVWDIEKENIKKEYREEGVFSTLAGLVRDNILSIKIAAQRAGLTEEVFKDKMRNS